MNFLKLEKNVLFQMFSVCMLYTSQVSIPAMFTSWSGTEAYIFTIGGNYDLIATFLCK
jgi:hypothetical protein